MLDNLNIEDIKPSSRRYPAVIFTTEREAGDQILSIENLSYSDTTGKLFDKISLNLNKGDKIILYSKDTKATTALYEILNDKIEITCPVRLLHGKLDKVIAYNVSEKIIEQLSTTDKSLTIIEDGNHNLSRQEDLEILFTKIKELI